jgi:hypothetical protein
MDTKGMSVDNTTMGNLVRLELEKTNRFEVLDKYDVADLVKQHGIDINNCFGKKKLIEVGKLVQTDKMLSGSAEVFGDKIILILRLVDVKSGIIEKVDVMEYINQQSEIQVMVQLSINNLLDIPNDEHIVNLLVNYNRLITSPKTTIRLNGPRMGATYTTGDIGRRMQSSEEQGGFNMYPVTSMFGYQYEIQYLSAGDFQALIELVGSINGLESGYVVPSLTLMNGFRFNKSGWEFGLGPVFRGVKVAEGYFDGNNDWHLAYERPEGSNYDLETSIDSRGSLKLSTSLIVAVGKTFKSGYLNVPFNIYVSPRKQGTIIGMSFGFNVAKMPKL